MSHFVSIFFALISVILGLMSVAGFEPRALETTQSLNLIKHVFDGIYYTRLNLVGFRKLVKLSYTRCLIKITKVS